MSAAVPQDLGDILDKIDRPGSFCVSGSAPAVLPGLEVQGLGAVALPLTDQQVKALKKLCRQAPYGKGEQTLVDTSVRRVWELTPDRFSLTNPDWETFLKQTVARVQAELGLERKKLESHLYDLLLYEPGSFFLPHRDGEKLDRMVATLVVVLPSSFQGGELIVRHEGQEQAIDFGGGRDPFHIHFAAFYADCEHEIRPLDAGHRLALVYNLTLKKGKKGLGAPRSAEQVEAAARVLGDWARDENARKVVVTLDHQYTKDGLAWDTLKGADRARAKVLAEAARRAGCRAYLALLTLHESGEAEEDYGDYGRYGGRRGHWHDEYEEEEEEYEDEEEEDEDVAGDHEMLEVYETSLIAENLTDIEGGRLPVGSLKVEEEELLDPDTLKDVKPEEEFSGYTGNEGATLERWYRHAAVLLWPDRKHFEVLCDAGTPAAVEVLEGMVERWQQAGRKEAPALHEQGLTFAAAILARWPESPHVSRYDRPAGGDALLPLLVSLNDPGTLKTYLRQVLARDASADPGALLAGVCQEHGWDTFRPELEAVFKATTSVALPRNVRLLEQLCPAGPRSQKGRFEVGEVLARIALESLEALDKAPPPHAYYRPETANPEVLAGLARALLATEQEELLGRLVEHVLALPKKYPLEVLIAALTALGPWVKKHVKQPSPALARWLRVCCEQLEALTTAAPQEPTDWRRPAAIACKCADCAELKQFLNDAKEQVHRFRAREDRRRHLEDIIHQHQCDLSTATDRRGSPHTLICTKNSASYQRNLRTYHQNQEHLKTLRSIQKNLPR